MSIDVRPPENLELVDAPAALLTVFAGLAILILLLWWVTQKPETRRKLP